MQPQTKNFSAKTVVGLFIEFNSEDDMQTRAPLEAPGLWEKFNSRRNEIKTSVGNTSYGVVTGTAEHPEPIYVACVETSDPAQVPPGMKTFTIPAGNYAMFTHKGPINQISKTFGYIFGQWYPANQSITRRAPVLEIYDERFKGMSADSECDIGVAIK